MKGEAPVFEMPAYTIKAGKIQLKTGEYIHVVENEMFNLDFTVSPFFSMVFYHFNMRIEIYFLIY